MTTVNICGENGRRVAIEVHPYENDAAQNPDDANWLRCSIEVTLERFRGTVDNASLTTHDFAAFLSELNQVMEGTATTASLQAMEEALAIRIEVGRTGRADVTGTLRDINGDGVELSFTMDTDLSFLRQTQLELARIVAEYPVRDTLQRAYWNKERLNVRDHFSLASEVEQVAPEARTWIVVSAIQTPLGVLGEPVLDSRSGRPKHKKEFHVIRISFPSNIIGTEAEDDWDLHVLEKQEHVCSTIDEVAAVLKAWGYSIGDLEESWRSECPIV